MKISVPHLLFGTLFLIFGYLSYNQAITLFLNDFSGTLSDIRTILISPLFSAVFYLLYYLVTHFIFRKLSTYPMKREITFNALFLIANIVALLLSCTLFSMTSSTQLANQTQLVDINNQQIAIAYLVASVVTFILFAVIRKKWR